MSFKETVDSIKRAVKEIRSVIPKPLADRPTIILKEPIMKTIRRRIEEIGKK